MYAGRMLPGQLAPSLETTTPRPERCSRVHKYLASQSMKSSINYSHRVTQFTHLWSPQSRACGLGCTGGDWSCGVGRLVVARGKISKRMPERPIPNGCPERPFSQNGCRDGPSKRMPRRNTRSIVSGARLRAMLTNGVTVAGIGVERASCLQRSPFIVGRRTLAVHCQGKHAPACLSTTLFVVVTGPEACRNSERSPLYYVCALRND